MKSGRTESGFQRPVNHVGYIRATVTVDEKYVPNSLMVCVERKAATLN